MTFYASSLTVHEDADILATCQEAGGLGYVVKVLMETDLIPAMKDALHGREFVSRFPSSNPELSTGNRVGSTAWLGHRGTLKYPSACYAGWKPALQIR